MAAKTKMTKQERGECIGFFAFASPWIVGFLFFMVIPMVASAYISLTNWNLLKAPKFIGLANFQKLFHDPLFYKSLRITLLYTLMAVPSNILLSVLISMLLNKNLPGMNAFRTMFYLPSIISGVVISLVWLWMFQPDYGILNHILGWFGLPGAQWIYKESTALPSLVLMSLWSLGTNIVLYLAALQGIPTEQYEAASIDGANALDRFLHITIPGISPTLLFTTLTGVINSMQTFTQAYVMTGGGPNQATTFYAYYIYSNAFVYRKMGFASAAAWILFVIISVMTLVMLRCSAGKVYYDGGKDGDLL